MDTCLGEERVITGSPASSKIAPEGRLEGTTVPEVLWGLAQEHHTGTLVLERRGVTKTLALRDGRVVFATSTDPDDQLGPFLLRRGEIGLTGWLDADARLEGGQRLGESLVELGLLAPSALPRAVQEQVREIALSVFAWRDGGWRVTKVVWSGHEAITLDLAVEDLILAGTRRVRDWDWVRRVVGGSRAVYRATPASRDDAAGLGLTERLILEQLELPLRVDQLCSAVYAPTHDIYRALWALYVTGRVERLERRALASVGPSETEGVVDAAGVERLLLDLADRRFTGTIRLFRGAEEGALFLRDGRIEFASTSDQEQSLAAHLVRRGVISDRDQDEAVRQLITGKRMGTLLAERGVLLPEDVERFVREQVVSVARGLVLWTSGEYETDPGATVDESIVLGITAEDLAVSAWESLGAWHRIWQRLGGIDSRFRLRPDYLDRLDRMTLRPAMWDVVALLAEPRSVREILDARPGSDFELCRLLCALQAARVIDREAPDAGRQLDPLAIGTAHPGGDSRGAADLPAPAVSLDADSAEEPPAAPAASAAELAPELFAGDPPAAPPAWVELPLEPLPMGESPAFELADPGALPPVLPPVATADDEAQPPEPAALLALELGEPSAVPAPGYEEAWFAPLPAEPVVLAAPAAPADATAPPESAEPGWEAMPWTEADLTGPLPLAGGAPPPPGAVPWEPMTPEELAEAEYSPTGPLTSAVFGDEAQWLAFQRAASAPREDGPVPVPASEPPTPEMVEAVERFNGRHGLVFQQLRLEIGAAIRNLVAACVRRMGPSGVPFEGIVLDRNGHFDVDALARSIRDGWAGDPAEPLEELIRQELAMVRDLVSAQRIASIEAQLNAL